MFHDETYLARAFELARLGRFTTAPNPNVGCVIVRDGQIVGEGYHLQAGQPHAEVHALRMAGDRAQGATAYITLEPCNCHGRTPPCVDALVAAGITRVVAATQDPNPEVSGRGFYKLKQAGVEVQHGLMLAEAEEVNRGFFKRMRTQLPYLQLKIAASLDGRTAMASGESKWITSPQARADVQCFRAQCSAILSTSATVLADDPALTVRWEELGAEIQALYPQKSLSQPIRVIIDSQNRITPQHRVIQQPGACWLVRLRPDDNVWPADTEQLLLPKQKHGEGVDLMLLMKELARRQINSVWVEAGAQLAGALLNDGVVDELLLYVAPKLLGDNARALCILPEVSMLSQAPEFIINDVCQIGSDLRLRLQPKGVRAY